MNNREPNQWTVTHNSWNISTVYDANGNIVAEIPIDSSVTECTQEELEAKKEARARLISAAPDMRDVLHELLDSARYWGEYDVPIGIVDRMKSALSKAMVPS